MTQLVTAVDDDGSNMIEFPEFLNIIKGGSKSAKVEQPEGSPGKKSPASSVEGGTAAIYSFFKKLTDGELFDSAEK